MSEYWEDYYTKMAIEQDVVMAADMMLEYDWSVATIAENMNLPTTRVYKYLRYNLASVNEDMYNRCRKRMKLHRWNRAGKLW